MTLNNKTGGGSPELMPAVSEPREVAPTHDKEMARRFLEALDPDATNFTFQLFADHGSGRAQTMHGTLDDVWSHIVRENVAGRDIGVFVTVNETDGKGRKRENIVRARTLFVDADSETAVQRCAATIKATSVTPTVIVKTSDSKAHFYWCIDDLLLEDFDRLQAALIILLGTDPAVRDRSRVMRLPGTLHLKDPANPRLVRLVGEGTAGPRWTCADFIVRIGLDSVAVDAPARTNGVAFEIGGRGLSAVFKPSGPNGDLSAGIEPRGWFSRLMPVKQDECLRDMLNVCRDIAAGAREAWLRIMVAAHSSGAPEAEEITLEWCKTGGAAFTSEADFQKDWNSFGRRIRGENAITIATLIKAASERGFDAGPWKTLAGTGQAIIQAAVASVGEHLASPARDLVGRGRNPLRGGRYNEAEALVQLNSWFFIDTSNGETAIYRIEENGLPTFMRDTGFKKLVANVRVRSDDNPKYLSGERFWLQHPERQQCKLVFRPAQLEASGEYNLWRGYGIGPKNGWDKQRRLLRHIREVICKRDRAKFKYVMRWLAWAIQHPDDIPETVIVLKSRTQGSGKSTLGNIMCKLFGVHGHTFSDAKQLIGDFTPHLETTCFVNADEAFFAGDARTADKLKSTLTSPTLFVNEKYRSARPVPNRMHVMMTTNHDHAVAMGARDRRFIVFEVSPDRAQNNHWFGPLYSDLDGGGYAQFLHLLLNLKLGDWHPREGLETEEGEEQKRMSGDSIAQWSRACIEADAVIGTSAGGIGIQQNMGQELATEVLRAAYTGYCKQKGLRPANDIVLGRALTSMFGSKKRFSKGSARPWGFFVPDGDAWQQSLDKRERGA